MSIRIKSGLSTDILEVNSNNELTTIFPIEDGSNNSLLSISGYLSPVSEIDDGSITGSRYLKQFDSSQDYRLRVGKDKIIWQDKFNYSILNLSNYAIPTLTQTVSLSSGYLSLNSSESTTNGAYSIVETYRYFSNFDTYPIYVDLQIAFSISLVSNLVIEFGLGIVSTTVAPTDGVFFRVSGGTIHGVISNNSSETIITNIFTPSALEINHYLIIFNTEKAEFWVNNVLRGTITTPTSLGSVSSSNSLPLFFRNYNQPGLSTGVKLLVSQASVSLGDMVSNKNWEITNIGSGLSSINYPSSYLSGQTANITNNSSPTTASTLSNTTAAYTTLGGDFIYSATTAGETDYILFAFQCPSGSTTSTGKNLMVTGIQINTFNGNVATGANITNIQWGMAFGSTEIPLDTSDSLVSSTRGPRRITLGCQTFASSSAAFAVANNPIRLEFKTAYMVEPSTYLHVFFKTPIAPIPASNQYFRGNVSINGYFE